MIGFCGWSVLFISGLLYAVQKAHTVSQTATECGHRTKCVLTRRVRSHRNFTLSNCVPYTQRFPKGYCLEVLGNKMVSGTAYRLEYNEDSFKHYLLAYDLIKGLFGGNNVPVTERCRKLVDDMYCHAYFPQCRISSDPQRVCREACERMNFKVCKEVFEYIKKHNDDTQTDLKWRVLDCTKMPTQNLSNSKHQGEQECYNPDEIRDQLDKLTSTDCYFGIGEGYSGNISVTTSGHTCQSWKSQFPHQHPINVLTYPELAASNASNLCRNPGGLGTEGPWCFTTNPNVTWEYCAVKKCPKRGPSRAPRQVKAWNTSSTSIQLTWEEIPQIYRHGVLTEYYVTCRTVNSLEWFSTRVPSTSHAGYLSGLESGAYNCRVRGVNNFGNGTWSDFVNVSTIELNKEILTTDIGNTASEKSRIKTEEMILTEKGNTPSEESRIKTAGILGITTGCVAAAILAGVALLAYYRHRRNGTEIQIRRAVDPYAVTHINEILEPFYEEINERATHRFKSRYVNLKIDGTLNLPPHLQDAFIDFEQLYENLRYKRLEGIQPRRRSFCGALDEHGCPVYDVLTHPFCFNRNQKAKVTKFCPTIHKKHPQNPSRRETSRRRSASVDLGQVKAFAEVLERFGNKAGAIGERCGYENTGYDGILNLPPRLQDTLPSH